MPSEQFPIICETEAKKFGVNPAIHEKDFLFQHIIHSGASEEQAAKSYFNQGHNSAVILRDILSSLSFATPDITLLDFASGYGMVARHLPVLLPTVTLTTSDIHPEANAHNAEHLKIKTIQSTTRPQDLNSTETFDAVFALSFFTHLPHETFGPWLAKLYSFVKKGGYLIFTTHGRFSANTEIPEDQLVFARASEQGDLDLADYGTSYVSPTYVMKYIYRMQEYPHQVKINRACEGFWNSNHDLFVVAKN